MPAIAAPVTSEVHTPSDVGGSISRSGNASHSARSSSGLRPRSERNECAPITTTLGSLLQRMRERIDHRDGKDFVRHGWT